MSNELAKLTQKLDCVVDTLVGHEWMFIYNVLKMSLPFQYSS